MKQTRQLDNLTDSQKSYYINDLPYFGWNIDNVQKVDNTKMHVEKNLLSKDLKIENNYYWTITISRDTNMPNFNELDRLFMEYIEERSDYETKVIGGTRSFSIYRKFLGSFITMLVIALIILIIYIPLFGLDTTILMFDIPLICFAIIGITLMALKIKKMKKLINSSNKNSKIIDDILDKARELLDK